ncbi:GntR family transcriptional regulator [Lutimaribacter sp. EGI FJ00015]|uniref:GntR family transcriptional regulator n=1 Tax=Lutimaribacter degradans TaxID=2945989 RepID=A0ACC6A045_9RHOB|nr:GntR family transcriptional regulator [Lutimaribacter sp. EGI FJ00013]MCM2563376.1 GntR family transcriptional regulator [Lutimaribacter sp. EGI FJ00013]MCO0614545.1 GntR family transcriptional regulator [Lutimaribacter sp. EGI FJ00015]MCO0637218.1 GntR family transcriptional regulator [Lutimaribacter sp. EGI FJ00014]
MNLDTRHSWTDVRDKIRARILDRTYAPGDKLPRDEDIAREFGCARTTVHRAMQDLSLAGLVERKRKGGTHVRADPVTRATFDIPITRREVEQKGAKYNYQLISREIEQSPIAIMARFGIQSAVEMLHVKALHLADNCPYIFEDRWIDIQSMPEVLDVDLTGQSANEWLVHNKPYSRVEVSFSAMNAEGENAQHLSAPVGSALFVIERTTWIGTAPITTVQAAAAPGYRLTARN